MKRAAGELQKRQLHAKHTVPHCGNLLIMKLADHLLTYDANYLIIFMTERYL